MDLAVDDGGRTVGRDQRGLRERPRWIARVSAVPATRIRAPDARAISAKGSVCARGSAELTPGSRHRGAVLKVLGQGDDASPGGGLVGQGYGCRSVGGVSRRIQLDEGHGQAYGRIVGPIAGGW